MPIYYGGPVADWPEPHGFDAWPYYSPLNQIRTWNARYLQEDWQRRLPLPGDGVTLTMQRGTLRVCAAGVVRRLHSETGELLSPEEVEAGTAEAERCPDASTAALAAVAEPGQIRAWGLSAWDEARCRDQMQAAAWPLRVRITGPRDPSEATDYVVIQNERALRSPLGLPCTRPPWTLLEARERDTGRVRWSVPLGTTRNSFPFPLWFNLGAPLNTPSMLTDSRLIFVATQDQFLRIIRAHDGSQVWSKHLPGEPVAGPITYRSSRSAKQRVVVLVAIDAAALTLVSFSAPDQNDARR